EVVALRARLEEAEGRVRRAEQAYAEMESAGGPPAAEHRDVRGVLEAARAAETARDAATAEAAWLRTELEQARADMQRATRRAEELDGHRARTAELEARTLQAERARAEVEAAAATRDAESQKELRAA